MLCVCVFALCWSSIVKDPTPGRTRDFNISVPIALAFIKQILAYSSAF